LFRFLLSLSSSAVFLQAPFPFRARGFRGRGRENPAPEPPYFRKVALFSSFLDFFRFGGDRLRESRRFLDASFFFFIYFFSVHFFSTLFIAKLFLAYSETFPNLKRNSSQLKAKFFPTYSETLTHLQRNPLYAALRHKDRSRCLKRL
jgi:hypothetical protein